MKKMFLHQGIKIRRFFKKYVNGTKGIISILLILLMLPFISIAGILINAARINSAVAVFDEALCNASDSTLGTYDEFLRSRFGLLAVTQSGKSAGYSQTDFINDMFQAYMTENMKALGNTYDSSSFQATGILPLSNMSVLKNAVFEASKYAVPTKFAMDGLLIEDLLKKLFKPLEGASMWMDEVSNAGQVAMDAEDLQDKIDEARDAMHTLEEKIAAYNEAYKVFLSNDDSAVKTYNATVDTVKAAVEAAQTAANDAQAEYSAKNSAVISAEHGRESLISEYNSKKNNADELAAFMEAHGDEIQPWLDAVSARDAALAAKESADDALDQAIADAKDTLSGPRAALVEARDNYKTIVDELVTAVSDAKAAVIACKDAISKFEDSCNDLAQSSLTIGFDYAKNSYDDQKERLEQERLSLLDEGQDDMAAERQTKIDQIETEQAQYDNIESMVDDQMDNVTDAHQALRDLASKDFETLFDGISGKLAVLSNDLATYSIPGVDDVTSKFATSCPGSSITDWNFSFDELLDVICEELLKKIVNDLCNSFNSNPGIQSIKMLIKFIFSLSASFMTFDPNLENTIASPFCDLPSRQPTEWFNDQNPYREADEAKYLEYKETLGAYGDGTEELDEIVEFGVIVQDIMDEIDDIKEAIDDLEDSWLNFFSSIAEIIQSIAMICGYILQLIGKALTCLGEFIIAQIKAKLLITGYCAYNLANRTTYTGKGLMGESYSLPDVFDVEYHFSAFSGAELEYIFAGLESERLNQTACYYVMYMLRALNNIPFIFTNEEVETLCTTVGPVTFGIGAVVCWILYIVAESYVDMVILCGGGSVPVIKRPLYLTVQGFPSLITDLTSITLSAAQKSQIKTALTNGITQSTPSLTEEQKNSIGSKAPSSNALNFFSSLIKLDYTKHMIIMISSMVWNDIMLLRLADVIQLECNYHSRKTAGYQFDLSDAYTYLRVSGDFETNEFIRMSGMNEDYSYKYGDGGSSGGSIVDRIFTSDERILYRGY